uniref:EGF-like domain-containing protein n=1 Tax=Takifugu rubripes TaxID=31033 RepID=A0A674NJU4_TAKRU
MKVLTPDVLPSVLLPLLATLHLSAAPIDRLLFVLQLRLKGVSPFSPTDSVEGAKVVHPYAPCGSDYAHYCGNGGQCIFPQDTDKPSCICTSSFKGERCLFFSDHSRALPELEQLVAISVGLAMVVVTLVVVVCCVLRKR